MRNLPPAIRYIAAAVAALCVLCALVPPWVYTFSPNGAATTSKAAGYHFVLTPPPPEVDGPGSPFGVHLDTGRILLQLIAIGGLGFLAALGVYGFSDSHEPQRRSSAV